VTAHFSQNPLNSTRRNTQALEAERARDALAAMKALQRKMREQAYQRLYGTTPPEERTS
jgi:hypothetical protein